MAENDWKAPFYELRQNLTTLYYGGLRIFHRVVASTVANPLSHCSIRDNLSVELPVDRIQHRVAVSTPDIAAHLHVFYSSSNRAVEQMGSSVRGLSQIVGKIPADVVPAIRIPKEELQSSNDLAHWMALVYSIAWEMEAIYLPAGVECMVTHDDDGTYPWNSLRRPTDADPRPWLIHQKDNFGGASMLRESFDAEEIAFPEIFIGYLERDVLECSVAAIDVLTHLHDLDPWDRDDNAVPKKARLSTQHDVWMLRSIIEIHHDPKRNGGETRDTLSSKEIMALTGWSQPKVSRVMKCIFGSNPMKKYRGFWVDHELMEKLKDPNVAAVDPAKD